MNLGLLESLSIYVISIGIILFILLSYEIGYQISKRVQTQQGISHDYGHMVGGVLAMLAFVLAFTFSMAASQHSARKQHVLNEANAIGTAYLRADLIDAQHGTEIKRLLRSYVDARLLAVDKKTLAAAITKSIELHGFLWRQVSSTAVVTPNTNTSLLIQSINDVIDMHEKRVAAALTNRIPYTIWIAIFTIAALAMITLGIQTGLSKGARKLVVVIPLILAFASLLTVIVDLDRPQRGIIKVGQQSMINLQVQMNSDR